MKIQKTANLIMVVIIIAILLAGILIARALTTEVAITFGGEYQITPIAGNRLIISEAPENLCSVSIHCDSVLKNPQKLDPAKVPYVPEDGIILPVITVEFNPGETAFDVLKRVCDAVGLQLEYSWTPLYDSYYVEGINHLYEFDCGYESGWMYQVNDGFPNYGSSAYELKPGDKIEWKYTCVGLGTDVGAQRME